MKTEGWHCCVKSGVISVICAGVGLAGLYEKADIIVSRNKFWVKSQTYWTVVLLHHLHTR